MADILASTQQQIDEAVKKLEKNAPAGTPPPNSTTSPLPPEPPPPPPAVQPPKITVPPVIAEPAKATSPDKPIGPTSAPGNITTEPVINVPPVPAPTTPTSSIPLADKMPESSIPPAPTVNIPPPKKSRGSRLGVILSVLLLLFITIPIGVYYVSQQQQVAELRSRAATGPYPQCSRVNQVFTDHDAASITVSQAMVNECTSKCPDGKLWVARYKCDGIKLSQGCQDNGEVLSWNAGVGQTFSANNPSCGTVQVDVGCINAANTYGSVGGVSKGASQACSEPPPPPPPGATSTPTPTPLVVAQCQRIKVYHNGNPVDPTTLKPGDNVELAVAGANATKGRIRVNGGPFTETTTKNARGEYTVPFTIPSGITNFTIEAEVFGNGIWQ